jgi:hypothetical protein
MPVEIRNALLRSRMVISRSATSQVAWAVLGADGRASWVLAGVAVVT